MIDVNNLVAIVTGASQGIGAGIAEVFAEMGVKVALFDINQKTLERQRQKMADQGFDIITQQCDVSNKNDVTEAVGNVVNQWRQIDILVNNAGISRDMSILKMQEKDWDDVIRINLRSQFLCSQAVLPIMVEKNFGRIINISSRAMMGGRGQTNYSASKGGVVSLTKSLALEFAKKGITANAICPGIIRTPMFEKLDQSIQEQLTKTVPNGRIGEPREVGRVAAFFADRWASYITGQVVFVCGGRSI